MVTLEESGLVRTAAATIGEAKELRIGMVASTTDITTTITTTGKVVGWRSLKRLGGPTHALASRLSRKCTKSALAGNKVQETVSITSQRESKRGWTKSTD